MEKNENKMSRRGFLKSFGMGAGALALGITSVPISLEGKENLENDTKMRGSVVANAKEWLEQSDICLPYREVSEYAVVPPVYAKALKKLDAIAENKKYDLKTLSSKQIFDAMDEFVTHEQKRGNPKLENSEKNWLERGKSQKEYAMARRVNFLASSLGEAIDAYNFTPEKNKDNAEYHNFLTRLSKIYSVRDPKGNVLGITKNLDVFKKDIREHRISFSLSNQKRNER